MPESLRPTLPQLVLAFDFGLRRIGVACGDTLSRHASALNGVSVGPNSSPWEGVHSLIREWQPAFLVVGIPYNVDGTENVMTNAARSFANELAHRYSLEVRLVDERYSSLEASSRLREARAAGIIKRRVVKADIDAVAACVILERWFIEGI